MNRRHFFANLTGTSNNLVSLNTMSNIDDAEASNEVISSLINNNDKVLVVIQLIGGNDCLNTIVPLDRYDVLMKHRGNIMLEQNRLLKINDTNAFHPKFKHVPPRGPLSTTATLFPFESASLATPMPAPEPITKTSYFFILTP